MIAFRQVKFNEITLSSNNNIISGYYINKPILKISQKWADDKRVLNEEVLAAFNFVRLAEVGVDVAGDMGTEMYKAFKEGKLFTRLKPGQTGDTVLGTIGNSALAGVAALFKGFGQENMFRTAVATTQAWQGSDPPIVDIDIIFLDKNSEGDAPLSQIVLDKIAAFLETTGGPSYMGTDEMLNTVEPDIGGWLHSLVNKFKGKGINFDFEGWRGPSAWTNANFGIGGVKDVINGTDKGLISLLYRLNNREIVNIPHFWLVDGFSIETSDQLFSTPSSDLAASDPGYKWIKLNISLKGATIFPANWIKKLYMPKKFTGTIVGNGTKKSTSAAPDESSSSRAVNPVSR